MDRVLLPFKQNKLLNTLFLSNIFVFSYALVIYLNSSFLSNYFEDSQISTLYIIGSILNVVILLNASKILEKVSNYKFSLYTIGIEFTAILCLAFTNSPFLIALSFITHLSAISTLLFNLDVFVESVSDDESLTGSIRGTYLTITNIMIVLAPLSISFLLANGNYSSVYILSALLLIPLYLIVRKFKHVNEAKMHHIEIQRQLVNI
jgi:MFS family permease